MKFEESDKVLEEIATRDSWTTHPLPDKHARLTVSWSFTESEFEQMKQGLIPEVMEDKWFIYHADGWFHFHRSWTGYCIYQVQIQERKPYFRVAKILVSRDVNQYQESSDEYDLMLLKYLIDSLLLGNNIDFPPADDLNGEVSSALHQHHLAGRGRIPPDSRADG